MLVLGLESSAHTFGAGIVDNGRILANEKSMYKIAGNGMIPAKVSEFHVNGFNKVINAALDKAGVKISEIEGIGYTRGPGLGPCLQVAQVAAKTISMKLGVKVAMVNHSVGHVEITRHLSKLSNPIVLYVSGGNSQILRLAEKPFRHYAVLGETLDIGVGNMLDSFARGIGLLPAWGSTVEKSAAGGRYVKLPYSVKGMDFNFTGLLTSALSMKGKMKKEDLCFSMQETAFSMLCEALERSMLLTGSKEVGLCGGVAQNKRLGEMLASIAKSHGAKFGCAPNEFNADNGAMIAYVAERILKHGRGVGYAACDIDQRYRIDSAEVF